jgi:alpha-ribazole phosphatase
MTKLVLLRHGKVDGSPALYGKTDIGVSAQINDDILAQLNEYQKNAPSPFTKVISSPLKRCAYVAEKFAFQNGLPFEREVKFQEMDFGLVDGITFDDIRTSEYSEQTWKQLERFWNNPKKHVLPEAEPLADFYQRVESAWQALLETNHNETILLVCHGGVIRMILSYLLDMDWGNKALYDKLSISNASATLVKHASTIKHSQVMTISAPLQCIAASSDALGFGNP